MRLLIDKIILVAISFYQKLFYQRADNHSVMPVKKKATENDISAPSPFQSADKLFKEDNQKSLNQKRFENWTDLIIRERKLAPGWKSDEETNEKVRWISGRSNTAPIQKRKTIR
jgi:hypothetical protein